MADSKHPFEEQYLDLATRDERLQFLSDLVKKNKTLGFEFVSDMLQLPLTSEEKAILVKLSSGSDTVGLESFLHAVFLNEDQDIATPAIIESVERSSGILGYRFLIPAMLSQLPQRVIYTVLLHAHHFGGKIAVKAICYHPGVEELSPAFHSLLLQQAVVFNISDPVMDRIAHSYLEKIFDPNVVEDRVFINLIPYLARFDQNALEKFLELDKLTTNWQAFAKATTQPYSAIDSATLKEIAKLDAQPIKLLKNWPSPWHRYKIEQDQILEVLHAIPDNTSTPIGLYANLMKGIDDSVYCEAMNELETFDSLVTALNVGNVFLPRPLPEANIKRMQDMIASSKNPADDFLKLPLPYRQQLKLDNTKHDVNQIMSEKRAVHAAVESNDPDALSHLKLSDLKSIKEPTTDRERFFRVAFDKQVGYAKDGKDFWSMLGQSWINPNEKSLGDLAKGARKSASIAQLSYLCTLSRFKDKNEAALKILDFIRTENEDELRAIVHAFASIGTERALQELVSLMTKPNMTPSLQLEACELLKAKDCTAVQKEIRSAISDLTIDIDSDDVRHEVRDNLKLLLTTDENEVKKPQKSIVASAPNMKALDQGLSTRLPHYDRISSEVKSALRTASFFHQSIDQSNDVETIDFSPLIDMQYKALELIFREMFEGPCAVLINKGILQRKLDVIGYARPIPAKMNEFEEYMGSLPIINSIPFFSKFKLRKMLRSLCQYRPGKRFTLDGLKAFGLFFLCFSRHECRYGLERIFPLPYATDEEFFEFVKNLHIFQDFRNRAAHEGFPPAARNNLDGIWDSTAEILENVFLIKEFISENEGRPKSSSKVA